jgi:hypothetical protein
MLVLNWLINFSLFLAPDTVSSHHLVIIVPAVIVRVRPATVRLSVVNWTANKNPPGQWFDLPLVRNRASGPKIAQ